MEKLIKVRIDINGNEFFPHHEREGRYYYDKDETMCQFKPDCTVIEESKTETIEEENAEHTQKLEHLDVAGAIAGFKLKPKDLDMIVTVYELLLKFGGKLDLDTITKAQYEVEQRHIVK